VYITIGGVKIPVIRIVVAVLVVALFYRIRDLLFPFVFAGIVAFILLPLVQYLEKKRVNRVVAILIIYIIVFSVLGVSLAFLIPVAITQIFRFVEALPEYTLQVQNFIVFLESTYEQVSLPQNLRVIIDRKILQVEVFFINTAENLIERVFGIYRHVINILIMPIFTFYILKDTNMIEGAFYDLFSDASKARARRFMVDLNRVMRQFFRGQFTVVIILAVVYTSVYSIMGVRYALLFGIFSGLANVVPYLGPTLATILPMSIALFTSVELAVGVLIISVIIQQIEGNIITPRILGSRVELHPLIIILAVLAGGRLFGLGGMLFAIPMAGTIKVVIRHFIRREHMQLF